MATSEQIEVHDLRLAERLKALGHPMRPKLLQLIREGVPSPSQLADSVGLPVANISYHVNQLRNAGLIALSGLGANRGAIQHFYEAVDDGTIVETISVSPQAAARLLDEIAELVKAAEPGHVPLAVAVVPAGGLLP